MKKKILASTMASVMALSAGAAQLTSFAAVADYKGLTMTKAELKKFLEDKEIVDLAENGGIDDYGSITGDNFMAAYEYAVAVVDDTDLTDEDATAAYLMVKAAKAALVQHDKKELAALVEQCRSIYETDNILNDNDDAIYKSTDWVNFTEAFEEADGYTDYDDIRVTSDAFEKLDKYKNPGKMETKTKSEINAARRDYEKALAKEFDFEPWQRGTVSGTGTKYDGKQFAWGALYANIKSGDADVTAAYEDFDRIKGLNKTSNETIVKAVKNMETAAKVLNGFKSTMESGTKSKVNNLLSTYYGQLVYDYNPGDADALATAFKAKSNDSKGACKMEVMVNGSWTSAASMVFGTTSMDAYWNVERSGETDYKPLDDKKTAEKVEKLLKAELAVRCSDHDIVYFESKKELINGKKAIDTVHGFMLAADVPATPDGFTKKTLSKGQKLVLSDYVEVSTAKIAATVSGAASTAIDDAKDAIKEASTELYVVNSSSVVEGTLSGANGGVETLWSTYSSITQLPSATGSTMTDISSLETRYSKTATDNTGSTMNGLVATAVTAVETAVSNVNDAWTALVNGVTSYAADAPIDAITSTADATAAIEVFTSALPTAGAPAWDDGGLESDYKEAVKALTSALAALETAVKNYNEGYTWDGTNSALVSTIDATKNVKALPTTATALVSTLVTSADVSSLTEAIKALGDALDPGAATDTEGFTNKADQNEVFDAPGVENHGTLKDGIFVFSEDYATHCGNSSATAQQKETTVNLAYAVAMYEGFTATSSTWTNVTQLDLANLTGKPTDNKKAVSAAAWKILYNYTKYSLEDHYKGSSAKTYTKKDVEKLLNDSYDLAEKTIETAMFSYSHSDLYDIRNEASDWLKAAKADKSAYKDDKQYNGKNATEMYKDMKEAYDQLKKEYDGFKYSYGEIAADMVAVAKIIEDGKYNATVTADLTKQLETVADLFVKVDILVDSNDNEFADSAVFSDDGLLNIHNRVLTSDGLDSIKTGSGDSDKFKVDKAKKETDKNHSHWALMEAYEKLVKMVEDAEKAPATDIKDVDGNGKFELADITALLKLYTDNKTDAAKHDIDGNGKVDLQDVIALLKAYTA